MPVGSVSVMDLKRWSVIKRSRYYFKILIRLLIGLCCLTLGLLVYTDYLVQRSCTQRCFATIAAIPERDVGVVLGTSKTLASGQANAFYDYRLKAASTLYLAGKVKYLVVSGDNGSHYYDEVTDMRADLIALGVPAEHIYRDYAGFRTLDSMVRMDKVFQTKQFVVISQAFHNERALYLAQHLGLDAVGFNAQDVAMLGGGLRTQVREKLARFVAVLEVYFTPMQPRFLGDPVQIGVSAPT